jgi:hypothetical protein
MIKIEIPSFRETTVFPITHHTGFHSNYVAANTETKVSIEMELSRRQHIINGLLKSFLYKEGDKVTFKDDNPSGTYRIKYIVKRAFEIKEDWPPTNNPLLVVLEHDDLPEEQFFATTNKIGSLVV